MSFLKATALKFREMLASPALLAALFLLPVFLGLAAGASNRINRNPGIRVAVTDLDGTDLSRALSNSLARQGWEVTAADEAEARRLVDAKAVDGALRINPGFTAGLDSLDPGGLGYTPAEGSLTASKVLDAVTYAVIPYKSRLVYQRLAREEYQSRGVPLPEDFEELFDRSLWESLQDGAKQDFIFRGAEPEAPALSYTVNDYSMEVLCLGFFALLGAAAPGRAGIRRRLAASPRGLFYDYWATLIVLFFAGLFQMILYMGAMGILMGTKALARELVPLAPFLLMSLALAQGVALFHESHRLFLGLLLMLVLSLAGGCFLQLPEQMIRGYAQYIPHGWTLAALRGYPVPSPLWPAGISLAVLLMLFPLHARRAAANP